MVTKFKIVGDDPIPGRFPVDGARAIYRDLLSKLGILEAKSESQVPAGPLAVPHPTIRTALESCRGIFLCLGLISGMINVLMLTGSFFMLQIYDRVLPSQSVPTLVGLAILATALYILQGALELIRSRQCKNRSTPRPHAQFARLRRARPSSIEDTRRR